MSAFRGKADAFSRSLTCPLVTPSGRPPSRGVYQFTDILRVQPTGAPWEDRSEAEELADVRLDFTPQLLVLAVCFDKERRTALDECNR